MSDWLQLVLQQSLEEVLEKMFFIRSLGEASGDLGHSESKLVARLTFEGDPSGSLTLWIAQDAARSISADFLGEDECELTGQQVGEVVCELANMICGSVLSRVESAITFRLAPPQLAETRESVEEATGPPELSAVCCVEIGGGNLTVWVRTERLVCSMAEKHGC
jgi:CheY-specific phosphatase CheX